MGLNIEKMQLLVTTASSWLNTTTITITVEYKYYLNNCSLEIYIIWKNLIQQLKTKCLMLATVNVEVESQTTDLMRRHHCHGKWLKCTVTSGLRTFCPVNMLIQEDIFRPLFTYLSRYWPWHMQLHFVFLCVLFNESVENNSMMATSQGLVTSDHSII